MVLWCADLDSSGDGKLSHHELERALVELDINITTAQAHALVNFMGERPGTARELCWDARTQKRAQNALLGPHALHCCARLVKVERLELRLCSALPAFRRTQRFAVTH